MYVTSELQSQLSRGQLAIAKLDDEYVLVPGKIAQKIRQREETIILLLNDNKAPEIIEDDPYADYQIPDDLMW